MTKPNVLFIICHDLGTQLRCYGDESAKTSNVDSLAAQGIRFDNYFATAPQCSPSRGSIITGRYPHQNGLMGLNNNNEWNLNEDETGFPEVMRDAGYDTFCFGTWHINHDPAIFGIQRRVPDKHAAEIASLFEEYLAQRNDGRPFLAYLGFFEPHRDFGIGRYEPEDPAKVVVPPYLPDNELTRKDLAQFHAAVREMDIAVGRVLKALELKGLSDNTIVVFTSDHGIAFPRAKCTLYDPGLRTPLIIRWPGKLPEGRVFHELMSNTDLAPSLLDMLGLEIPGRSYGRSFMPLVAGKAYGPHEEIFAEKTYHCIYDPIRAIRTNEWKYIVNFEDGPMYEMPTDVSSSITERGIDRTEYFRMRPPEELYDLRNDPDEMENLAFKPEFSRFRDDLRGRLFKFLEETRDPILEGSIPDRRGPSR